MSGPVDDGDGREKDAGDTLVDAPAENATIVVPDEPLAERTIPVSDDAPPAGAPAPPPARPAPTLRTLAVRTPALALAAGAVFALGLAVAGMVVVLVTAELLRGDGEPAPLPSLELGATCAFRPDLAGGGTLVVTCSIANTGAVPARIRVVPRALRDGEATPLGAEIAEVPPGARVERRYEIVRATVDRQCDCAVEPAP